jgi:hypothetical protein
MASVGGHLPELLVALAVLAMIIIGVAFAVSRFHRYLHRRM